MQLAINEVACARDTVRELLDELALDAYLFELEPNDAQWEIRVECAISEGWKTMDLYVSKKVLLDCMSDSSVRRHMLQEWRHAFAECKLETGR